MACLVMAAGVALGPVAAGAATPADGRVRHGRVLPLSEARPGYGPSAGALPTRAVRDGAGGPASPPRRSPAASPSANDSPMAGRQAAKGRVRPGRSLTPMEAARIEATADEVPPGPDPHEVPVFTPPPGAFPEPGHAARQRRAMEERAAREAPRLSLGSGIVLVGLGLGFLAFRMRRAV
ncbi:hypothetical protein ABZ371_00170 [Streptomyces sp. NPDC005899]|uniref:hypothetical protein n=1 Tax=Streptomyces sp. NPDC005899 TaxID=3155716 RepID=UPI0033F9B5AE